MLEHIIDEFRVEVSEERVHQSLVMPIPPRIVVPLVQQVLQLELVDWHRSHAVRRILLSLHAARLAVVQVVVDVLEDVEDGLLMRSEQILTQQHLIKQRVKPLLLVYL